METRQNHGKSGTTLLEVMIATGIMGIVFAMFFQTLSTTNDIYTVGNNYSATLSYSAQIISSLEDDFREGKVIPGSLVHMPPFNHSTLTYYVPIGTDTNNDGFDDTDWVRLGDPATYTKDSNNVVWGVSFGRTQRFSPGSITIFFEPDADLTKQIKETTENFDLNNDGDRTDKFDIGVVKKTYFYSNWQINQWESKTVYVCKDVVQDCTNYSSDMDHDNHPVFNCNQPFVMLPVVRTGDPMFLVRDAWPNRLVNANENESSGTEIDVSFFILWRDADNKPILENVKTTFKFRNQN